MSTRTALGEPRRRRARAGRRKQKAPAPLTAPPKHPIADTVFASGFYARWLRRGQGKILTATPADPWSGEADRANAMFQGRYELAGHAVRAVNQPPWEAAAPSVLFEAELHAFEWLRDFRAADGPTARKHARDLIKAWSERHGQWHALAWRPDILSRRLVVWLGAASFLLADADLTFEPEFRALISKQARHLRHSARFTAPGPARIEAGMGLVIAASCLRGAEGWRRYGLDFLEREIDQQVLADGGHVTRNPTALFRSLKALISVRAALTGLHQEVPPPIMNAIDRMTPLLRFFRHGDGGLALFNGSFEDAGKTVGAAVKLGEVAGKAPQRAPYTGYESLAAGRTLVLIDTGSATPEPPFDGDAHAGPLAFEMSVGRERMIVNCGAFAGPDAAWHEACHATAAHSTLVIDDRSAHVPAGPMGPRGEVLHGEEEGGTWIDLRHDGYVRDFGVIHHRRFHLADDGQELACEDIIAPSGAVHAGGGARDRVGKPFALRFHLHPQVQASLVREGEEVLLRLGNGEGWLFKAMGGRISLEESVYMGRPGEMRRTEQIVVSAQLDRDGARLPWRFARMNPGG